MRFICAHAPLIARPAWNRNSLHGRFSRRRRKTVYSAGQEKLSLTKRRGVSAVEFAIVAPIFFFLVLVLIQFAGLCMSKNVLTAAAREGGRMASMPNTLSTSAVIATARECASRGGIDPELVTVDVSPTALDELDTGAEVRIVVSAPISELTWLWKISPPPGNMVTEMTYYRE